MYQGSIPAKEKIYALQITKEATRAVVYLIQNATSFGNGYPVIKGPVPYPSEDMHVSQGTESTSTSPIKGSKNIVIKYHRCFFKGSLFSKRNLHYDPSREDPFYTPRNDATRPDEAIQIWLQQDDEELHQFLNDQFKKVATLTQAGYHALRNWLKIIGIPDEYTVTGSQVEIFRHYGISEAGIANEVVSLLNSA